MATLISQLELEGIRKYFGLPQLLIELRPNWGSQNIGHREELHGELKKVMAKAYPLSDSSIAHCRSIGGYASSSYDTDQVIALGFDIEETDRINSEVVMRICKDSAEVAEAPSVSSLWAAKEAAYKSVKGSLQPKVISGIQLQTWKVEKAPEWSAFQDSQIETVCIKDPQQFNYRTVKGLVIKKGPYSLAIFVAFP